MMLILWLFIFATSTTAVGAIYVAATRHMMSNFLMAGFAVYAFVAAIYQLYTGRANLFLSLFNTGCLFLALHRIRLNVRGRASSNVISSRGSRREGVIGDAFARLVCHRAREAASAARVGFGR